MKEWYPATLDHRGSNPDPARCEVITLPTSSHGRDVLTENDLPFSNWFELQAFKIVFQRQPDSSPRSLHLLIRTKRQLFCLNRNVRTQSSPSSGAFTASPNHPTKLIEADAQKTSMLRCCHYRSVAFLADLLKIRKTCDLLGKKNASDTKMKIGVLYI